MNDSSAPAGFPVRRWATITFCLGLLAAVFLQGRTIARLRAENDALRAGPPRVQSGQRLAERVSGPDQEFERKRVEAERLELLQLRSEVGQLSKLLDEFQSVTPRARALQPGSQAPAASSPSDGLKLEVSQPALELPDYAAQIRELSAAAAKGDIGALDRLADLAKTMRQKDAQTKDTFYSELRRTFDALGVQAGQGDAGALKAIWQATRVGELSGHATLALGVAAAKGNQEALEPLLHPKDYLILESSAVGALRPVAEAGNQQAIAALAAVAGNPKQRPLWYMAAQGLGPAARNGNPAAIDALALVAADDNANMREVAVSALEAAARQNQPRAEEALRKLGWR